MKFIFSLILTLTLFLPIVGQEPIDSIYTDTASDKCKTIKFDEESSYSEQICPGVAGYKLRVIEGDLRVTINVVDPKGKEYELKMQEVMGAGFSNIGQKAEWRVKKQGNQIIPVALIVRFDLIENPEEYNKSTSFLTVAKITSSSICIVDKVRPNKEQNLQARKIADIAQSKGCL
ncbi:MAG: hypothetical protein JNM06_13785 [Blastocatellia bacterium]|nr:hypothetical protein [Blastocatellia bacterium]MBN8724567.1 hypothetical protein [Acidobacteriota bacterium]